MAAHFFHHKKQIFSLQCSIFHLKHFTFLPIFTPNAGLKLHSLKQHYFTQKYPVSLAKNSPVVNAPFRKIAHPKVLIANKPHHLVVVPISAARISSVHSDNLFLSLVRVNIALLQKSSWLADYKGKGGRLWSGGVCIKKLVPLVCLFWLQRWINKPEASFNGNNKIWG